MASSAAAFTKGPFKSMSGAKAWPSGRCSPSLRAAWSHGRAVEGLRQRLQGGLLLVHLAGLLHQLRPGLARQLLNRIKVALKYLH